jgi:hypothetical protein
MYQSEIHPMAQIALHAVALRPSIGAWAAYRFAQKRGAQNLYRLARQLDAAAKAGF